jgi:hypothetical protein
MQTDVSTSAVGTLSSGIVASISEIIDNPGSAVNLLAQNLPGAATFFITLILVSALTKAGGAILQVVKLLLYTVKVKLLGGNPRSLQKARHAMPQAAYGVQYPNQVSHFRLRRPSGETDLVLRIIAPPGSHRAVVRKHRAFGVRLCGLGVLQ